MKRLLLTLSVLALLVSSTFAASVFQLDVCNKHRTVSEAPGTSLTFTKDGMCIVTSQVLTVPAGDPRSCRASKASTAVLLRFPCKEEPRLKQASGPALNVWGSFDGIPQPTKHGMIVTESAPVKTAAAQPRRAAKLIDSRADGYVVSSSGSHNPGGYVVSGSGSSTPSGYVVSSSSNPNGYIVSSTGAGSSSGSPAGPIVIATNNAGTSDGYVVSSAGANTPAGYVVSTTDANAPAGYVVSTTDAKAPAGYVVSSNGGNAPAGYVVSTAGVNSSVTSSGACSFLTLNPGLYYHKSPPMFTYGYVVSGVPCDRAASALAATTELNKAGAKTFPTTYSLWLKPSLPAPPAGMSTEPQTCHLVISVLQRSYVSIDKFSCSMKTLSAEELDDGCCYNAGGMGRRLLSSTYWAGRNLLSSWEKAVWNRRAMLH